MDLNEEYHDPDYPGTSAESGQETQRGSVVDKEEKIRNIIRREFGNELEVRENDIMLMDEKMSTARRMLHYLRYKLVNNYYNGKILQLSNLQIHDEIIAQSEPRAKAQVTSILREGQRRLHPSVRKLLGKQTVDLDEIFKIREPRNKARKDYYAMVKTRNYTIRADSNETLRPSDQQPSTSTSSQPMKIPRHIEPKITNVMTLSEATRNKMKHRYRFIIGNTSKYAPAASRADRSTHLWLLYVRGVPRGDASSVLASLTLTLHHSYAPHHVLSVTKPPFHVSRRGWGEFPVKVELHFKLPERNRPVTVEHTIKLDRNYTGLQTLGAETIIDVWLYSTQEMLQYEYKEDVEIQTNIPIKTNNEPTLNNIEHIDKSTDHVDENINYNEITNHIEGSTDCNDDNDKWLDFFNTSTELDVDEMLIKTVKKEKNDIEDLIDTNVINKDVNECKVTVNSEDSNPSENVPTEVINEPSPKKRIIKYMDQATGKIYYLEMDRNLDLSKVQEIVFNSKGKTAKISPIKSNLNGAKLKKTIKKSGISLLKPEVKNSLKTDCNSVRKRSEEFNHIENDHCYLGVAWPKKIKFELPIEGFASNEIKQDLYNDLCKNVSRITSVRGAVNYLLKNIPIISKLANDNTYVMKFPFVVENDEIYWKLDFAKRRNIEWSRAKLINCILTEHFKHDAQIWRTKQILIFSRLHGFYPVRPDIYNQTDTQEWPSWDIENSRKLESNIRELYPNASDINSLSEFNLQEFLCQNISIESELTDSDEEIEIVNCDYPVKVKKEVSPDYSDSLTVLPVLNDDERLRYLFLERKCADIGIELRNEDVGNGYSYSAVHAVLLSAMKCFAEELVRSALAVKLSQQKTRARHVPQVWTGSSSVRTCIRAGHVYAATSAPRLHALGARGTGVRPKRPYSI